MLVNDMLQHKCLLDRAVFRPVACLSWRPQAVLLCVLNQTLYQVLAYSLQMRLAHCNRSVVGGVGGVPLHEEGEDTCQDCLRK